MSKTEDGDTITMEFTYNHAGLRTKKVKKVNGTVTETTEYILNGKNVVELIHTNHATSVTNKLHFFYDTQDKQSVVEFNGTKYSYAYNLQGDVVGIVDNTGNVVVQYSYDAWGKPIGTTANSTLTTQLAELNPFRYRGYTWDQETELYYLRSRYYGSIIGRFLSVDFQSFNSSHSDQENGILVSNCYAYCENNTVNRMDSDGCWWKSLKKALKQVAVAALCVAVIAVVSIGTGGAGTLALAAGYTAAQGMAVAEGIAIASAAISATTFLASRDRPGSNQAQNRQYGDVMKKLGIKKTDPLWRRIHDIIHRKGFYGSFNELYEFAKEIYDQFRKE